MTGHRPGGVTIGQAAAFADVTVKTVRHYHRHGLLPEPPRDGSGYRRYGSDDLLRLVQVRTLATAGVPLSRIAALLDAGPEQFAAALTEVERRLTERIEELIARRDTLHRVADDRALLPDRALAVLERMTALGFTPDYVAGQREALVLFRALAPEGLDHFLANLEHRLDDPEYVDLIKRGVAAMSWEPDDPRLDRLAAAFAAKLLAHRELLEAPADSRVGPDTATRYRLIDHHREGHSPAWVRLNALVEARLRAAGVPLPHG
ncbi:MerR family transcriptional regulator [Nocardiopsis trehalosi]|uniref:MerR family transcriptional regulator n=1 Tax=Nocardiopsis trehalosi TaxID=109329 RepID=UPI000832820B|nr:MerR family transcriptional regulator [Nocardiopsis trehalosi]